VGRLLIEAPLEPLDELADRLRTEPLVIAIDLGAQEHDPDRQRRRGGQRADPRRRPLGRPAQLEDPSAPVSDSFPSATAWKRIRRPHKFSMQ
jgi:hypothetical protein